MLLVSVIMPSYQAEEYIRDAVSSVISQTYESWELIIVDDASEDGTFAIASEMAEKEPRIRLFRNDTNLGSAGARNRAIEAAKGKLLAFLDSDDLWDPAFLERQVDFLQTHDCFGVTAGYRRLYQGSTTDFVPPKKIDAPSILRGNAISCLSTVFRKPDQPIYFDPSLRRCEDLYYWYLLLSQNGPFLGNPEVLATYRIRDDSKSRDKTKLIKWQWRVYKKCGLPFFKRLHCLLSWAFYGLKKYKTVYMAKRKKGEAR